MASGVCESEHARAQCLVGLLLAAVVVMVAAVRVKWGAVSSVRLSSSVSSVRLSSLPSSSCTAFLQPHPPAPALHPHLQPRWPLGLPQVRQMWPFSGLWPLCFLCFTLFPGELYGSLLSAMRVPRSRQLPFHFLLCLPSWLLSPPM